MDCRRKLWLGLALLGGAGCSHTADKTPQQMAGLPPPDAVIKKEEPLPAKTPKAVSCVAAGDFYVGEAAQRDAEPVKQEQLRDQARKAYQQALALDPKHLPAYRGLANLYVMMGMPDKAVEVLGKAVKKFPKDASVWYDMGMVQGRRKDWPRALEALARATELDPDNRPYASTFGFTLARAGRYDEAVACFTKLYGEARAYYNVARMLEHLKQPELCRRYALRALELGPTLTAAAELLARLDGPPRPAPGRPQPVQPAAYTDALNLPSEPPPPPPPPSEADAAAPQPLPPSVQPAPDQ
jgi:tetratricopeptide (TPR) repeat protein